MKRSAIEGRKRLFESTRVFVLAGSWFAAIPCTADVWAVSGVVLDEADRRPVASLELELTRYKDPLIWCIPFCYGEFRKFLKTETDADGKFRLTSSRPGNFLIRAKCPKRSVGLPLIEHLGRIEGGELTMTLLFDGTKCERRAAADHGR